MSDVRPGDVLPTKSLRVVIQDGHGWAEIKAPKGKQLVLLLLGAEETAEDGQKLDCIKALEALGWSRP